ncbi:toxin-antitoxin system HicB family antitoxin [Staphylococcus xylosus]
MKRLTLLINEEMHMELKKKAEQLGIPINQYILSILSKEV